MEGAEVAARRCWRQRDPLFPIVRVAELDKELSPQVSLAKAAAVISFVSTVLWVGGYWARFPYRRSALAAGGELRFDCEVLTLSEGLQDRLAKLLTHGRENRLQDRGEMEAAEWAALKPVLTDRVWCVDRRGCRYY